MAASETAAVRLDGINADLQSSLVGRALARQDRSQQRRSFKRTPLRMQGLD